MHVIKVADVEVPKNQVEICRWIYDGAIFAAHDPRISNRAAIKLQIHDVQQTRKAAAFNSVVARSSFAE
jgi:hypothetical protein